MVPEIEGPTYKNFCHFGPCFAFSASDYLENKNFKIEKNTSRYYDNHMTYGS